MSLLLLVIVGVGIVWVSTQSTNAQATPEFFNDEGTPNDADTYTEEDYAVYQGFPYIPDYEQNYAMIDYGKHPLLLLIQKRESGGRYNVVFGGRTFSDYSTHPYAPNGELTRAGIKPAKITVGINKGKTSSAAGRYQFLLSTWRQNAARIGKWDFTPDTQDHLAYDECVRIGAIADYNAGRYEAAIRKCARVWTSLPTATTGEVAVDMQTALAELQSYA